MSVTKSGCLCGVNTVAESKIEGYSIILRPMRVTDLLCIHRMYDSLSHESKLFIPSRIFGLENKSWYWVLGQAALIFSCNGFSRAFLRWVYPRASFFLVVAKKVGGEGILGFAYLRAEKPKGNFFLGIAVKDAYHEMKVGSRLTEELITRAKKGRAKKIVLSTHTQNAKAISLYRKYGFKHSSPCDSSGSIDMELNLKE